MYAIVLKQTLTKPGLRFSSQNIGVESLSSKGSLTCDNVIFPGLTLQSLAQARA